MTEALLSQAGDNDKIVIFTTVAEMHMWKYAKKINLKLKMREKINAT